MTRRQLERALRDTSMSDKKFFKILLKYFEEQNAEIRKSQKNVSVHSQDFQKRRAASASLRSLILALRPAVYEMVLLHVLRLHEQCCEPESKK